MATVRAPLKLVLAGEYAVLDDRGEAVVAAIDRYVEARAERIQNAPGAGEPRCEVSAPGLWEGAIELSGPDPATGALDREALGPEDAERLRFAGEALALGYQYLAELGLPLSPVRLRVDSRAGTLEAPTGERRKLGLGTSAASVVATLGALLAVHGVPIDRPTFRNSLLRIAIAAHTTVQGGRGSGVDVAAAVTGGVVCYRRCNTRFQKTLFDQNPSALEIARSGWPGLLADSTVVSKNIRLLIGFTG
ncbi:MAG: mevalonate kinase family protein, partial [Planctomycetota bacterium]